MATRQQTWKDRDDWAKQYEKELLKIIAGHIVQLTPAEQRMRHAIDVCITGAANAGWITRVRSRSNLEHNSRRGEYTFRFATTGGSTHTEFQKVLDGDGDYYLYSHADREVYSYADHEETCINLIAYRVLALRPWRQWYHGIFVPGGGKVYPIDNPDGTRFVAFRFSQLPAGIVLAEELPDWARPPQDQQILLPW